MRSVNTARVGIFPLHYAARRGRGRTFSKAVGTGMTQGLKWREIEVLNLPGGEPVLHAHGVAAELMKKRGATRVLVTLSHSKTAAVAVVVLENGEAG